MIKLSYGGFMGLFNRKRKENVSEKTVNDEELTDEQLEQITGGPNLDLAMQFLTEADYKLIEESTTTPEQARLMARDLAMKRYYEATSELLNYNVKRK